MKRFCTILFLLSLCLSLMAQDVTLKVGTYINDHRLAPGHHNYFMFDLQMSLRF